MAHLQYNYQSVKCIHVYAFVYILDRISFHNHEVLVNVSQETHKYRSKSSPCSTAHTIQYILHTLHTYKLHSYFNLWG